jgi:hypothetical protein
MYQRIDADGYNNYQSPPANQASISLRHQRTHYDSFHMFSLNQLRHVLRKPTSASSYWQRDVTKSSTEALQNIFIIRHLSQSTGERSHGDPQELRLTSRTEGDLQWVGGAVLFESAPGYITRIRLSAL